MCVENKEELTEDQEKEKYKRDLTEEQLDAIMKACADIRDMKEFAKRVEFIEKDMSYVEKDLKRYEKDIQNIETDVKKNKSEIKTAYITIEAWKNKLFEKIGTITDSVNAFIIATKDKVDSIKLDVNKQINKWMWALFGIIVLGFISMFFGRWLKLF